MLAQLLPVCWRWRSLRVHPLHFPLHWVLYQLACSTGLLDGSCVLARLAHVIVASLHLGNMHSNRVTLCVVCCAAVLDPAIAALQQHLGQCEARLRSGKAHYLLVPAGPVGLQELGAAGPPFAWRAVLCKPAWRSCAEGPLAKALLTARRDASSMSRSPHAHVAERLPAPAGPFAVGVRELLGHYMVLEEQFMEDTSDMAIRIDEVVSAPVGGGSSCLHTVAPCLGESIATVACTKSTQPHALMCAAGTLDATDVLCRAVLWRCVLCCAVLRAGAWQLDQQHG